MEDIHASPVKTCSASALSHTQPRSESSGVKTKLQRFHQASNHAELMDLLSRFLGELQFSDFAFTLRQGTDNPAYYFSTCAQANQYFHGLTDWEFDISAMYATPGDQPIYQTTIDAYLARAPFATSTMAKSRELAALARELGFEEMYHLPLPLRTPAYAMLTIAAQDCTSTRFHSLVDHFRFELEQLCICLGELIPTLFNSGRLRVAAQPQLALGHMPLLLLNALAKDNLSLNAAAERLCISVSAANKYVAAIKKNLEAKTIASAVFKAARLGLID